MADRPSQPLEGTTAVDLDGAHRTTPKVEFVLLVRDGKSTRVVPLPDGATVALGRDPRSTVVVEDSRASRNHAEIRRRGARTTVCDLGSRNGTWLNGERIADEQPLGGGDVVALADVTVVVAASGGHPVSSVEVSERESEGGDAHLREFIVADPAMVRVFTIVRRLAATTTSVLVLGETGVGKEVIVEQLHVWSPRAKGPFVRLNCAALPESLADAELFGYEKGAFTGAAARKIGYLEAAHGGTLMLDEIGELPLPLQAKLLRALESRRIARIGSTTEIPIDVRLASATCRDLADAVASGAFRKDLYFRISAFVLEVPALRERPSEIALLAQRFATELSARHGTSPKSLSPDAVDALAHYGWPGNIRELRNAIEHAFVLAEGARIGREHLPRTVQAAASQRGVVATTTPTADGFAATDEHAAVAPTADAASRAALDDEPDLRTRIVRALELCAGNQTQAAKLLGMSRRTFVSRLDELALPRPRKRSGDE